MRRSTPAARSAAAPWARRSPWAGRREAPAWAAPSLWTWSATRASSLSTPPSSAPTPPEGRPEPVVGWLVCIEGSCRGSDFRIHAGYNYIGRETGDIHIRGDQQISRKNHAMVAYDSSERVYYVGPSAGRNLIKVNGKTVLGAVEIHNYDVISIGTTKLMFVGLCGEQFGWEEEAR